MGPDREGPERRRRHADRVGQDALLQPARAPGARASAGRADPLPVPHQGARPGSARRARRAGPAAARDAHVHLRRRHAPGRAARGARARQSRAHEPGHAPLGNPAAPHQVGVALPEPPLRRDRRAARLPRRVRLASRQRAAPAHVGSAGTTGRRPSSSWPRRRSPTRRAGRAALIGEPVEEITESGAPTGDKVFVCYNPPVVNPELGIRAPYLGEAAKLALRFLPREDRHDRLRPEPAGHRGAC